MIELFRIGRPEWSLQITQTNIRSNYYKVILDLRDKDLNFPFERERSEPKTVRMPAAVEVKVHWLEITGLKEESHHLGVRRYCKKILAPAVFSELLTKCEWHKIEVSVKYIMFKDRQEVTRFSSHETELELGYCRWKIFKEFGWEHGVSIQAKNGVFQCPKHDLTRGSRVLYEQLSRVSSKKLVIEMNQLTLEQVEAFLRYQYTGNTDKILESPQTSLMILKEAERFQVGSMWDDTISALLLKSADFFEPNFAEKFKDYLKNCSRQQEFYPRELAKKLSKWIKKDTTNFYLNSKMGIWKDDYSPSIDDIPHGQFQIKGTINNEDENKKNTVLSEISNKIVESDRMINQVKLWFRKREWRVTITAQKEFLNPQWDQSTHGMYAPGRWAINFELRSTDYQPGLTGQPDIKKETIRIPAEIEVHLHMGRYKIVFDDMIQTICEDQDGSFHQNCKVTSADVINQLRTIPKSQIEIVMLASHRNIEPNAHVGLHDDTSELIESHWKVFLDQRSTDVTIQAKNGELIHCHRSRFARTSNVLLYSIEVVFEMQDLTRAQVEAFLRYQYCGSTDKIMESPLTSLLVLKQAERYEVNDMWNDTIKALLLKNSDWFEGGLLLEFKNYLDTCSRRFETLTDKLYRKISELLETASIDASKIAHKDTSNSSESEDASNSSESEDASNSSESEDSSNSSESVKKAADNFDMNAIEKEPEQGPSHKLHTLDTMSNMKDITEIDKILGSSMTVLTVLKLVEYQNQDRTWANIISVLLLKESGWFEGNSEELITFLASCSKRDEEATQILVLKLSRLQEKSNKTKEEKEGDNQDIGHTAVTTEDANQIEEIERDQQTDEDMATQTEPKKSPNKCNSSSLVEDSCETVSTSTESVPNVRRSSRLQVQKPAPVQKRGLQLDESWQNALERAAKRKKPATQPGKVVYGPRDIRKDPTLPKIAIFPGPELKVEKVEPSEEWSQETTATDTDENQHQINVQDPDSSTDAACLFGFVKIEQDSP